MNMLMFGDWTSKKFIICRTLLHISLSICKEKMLGYLNPNLGQIWTNAAIWLHF